MYTILRRLPRRQVGSVASAVSYKLKRDGENVLTSRPLYLDAQATTPLDPRVLHAMMPYQVSYYGNPHSSSHAYGWQAEEAVEHSRRQIANLIGAQSEKEVIFTSGATELM